MKIVITQPCDIKMRGFYENAIRITQLFFRLLTFAKDPSVKDEWIKAGLLDVDYALGLQKKIEATAEGGILKFTLDDTIQLYTCMDI